MLGLQTQHLGGEGKRSRSSQKHSEFKAQLGYIKLFSKQNYKIHLNSTHLVMPAQNIKPMFQNFPSGIPAHEQPTKNKILFHK